MNAQRLMIAMISFPRGEVILASWWDDDDKRRNLMLKMSRGTGSCPELGCGNENYEDINHIHVIKYNKHFKKVLTVPKPAEKQDGDTMASSCLELSGDQAPEEPPYLCRCSELI